MAYDSVLPTDVQPGSFAAGLYTGDFPVLTDEDQVSRLAEMYRQDSESKRLGLPAPTIPSAALTPSALSTPAPTDYGGSGDEPVVTTPATTPEKPAVDWSASDKWLGPPIDMSSKAPSSEEPGTWKSFAAGVTTGATGVGKNLGHVAGYVSKKIGDMTDSDSIKQFGKGIDLFVDALDEQARGLIPPQTISEAWDKGLGTFGNWLLNKTAESGVGMLPVLAVASRLGPWGAVAYGATIGAVEEARQPTSTNESVTAAAIKGGVEMGGVIKIMHATQTLPFFKRIAAQAMAFGGIGAAEPFAAAIPKMVRGEGYEAPTGEQVVEGGVVGTATGAAFGAGTPRVRRPEERPPAPLAPPAPPAPSPPMTVQGELRIPEPPAKLPPEDLFGYRPPQPPPAAQGELPLPRPRPPEPPPPEPPTGPQGDLFAPRGPRGAVEQGPAVSVEDPAVRAATELAVQGELTIPAPTAKLPPEDLFGYRPPPPKAASEARPTVPPEVTLDVTPPSRPREFTTEPDHENPNQHVAKDETGRVVAVGDTPEQALQFARAREATRPPAEAPPAPKNGSLVIPRLLTKSWKVLHKSSNIESVRKGFEQRELGISFARVGREEPYSSPTVRDTEGKKGLVTATITGKGLDYNVKSHKDYIEDIYNKVSNEGGGSHDTKVIKHLRSQGIDWVSSWNGIGHSNELHVLNPKVIHIHKITDLAATAARAKSQAKAKPAAVEEVAPAPAPAPTPVTRAAKPTPTTVVKLPPRRTEAERAGAETTRMAEAEAEEARIDTHFNEWLNRRVAEDERPTVRRQINELLQEHPELISQGKSWPELRALAERQATAKTSPPTTVGEELQQRQAARKRGEEPAKGPPTVTRANQPKRVSLMAQEVARGVGRTAAPRAPTRATPVEAIGERGPTETREGGIAETRAATTTDKNLHYSDLVHDVLQGNKTLDEASAAAGSKEAGTRGRPRRNKDLADYLDKVAIPRAEAAERADQRHMERVIKALQTTKGAKQEAVIRKLNDEMDARVAARGRTEQEREKLNDLKKMRDQLRGETTEGADLPVTPPSMLEKGKALIERMLAPHVNDPTLRRLINSEMADRPDSLHDHLREVVNNPVIKMTAPHLVELAQRYLDILPDSFSVTTYRALSKQIGDSRIIEKEQTAAGTYYDEHNTIALNPYAAYHVEALLHETTHAATFDRLELIRRKVANGEELNPTEQRQYDALNAVDKELRSILEATDEVPRDALEDFRLDYAVNAAGNKRIREGRHEIVTNVLTNPYVQRLLARTEPTVEFKAEMKRLGYGEPTTVWQGFKMFLKDLLGFKKNSNALDLMLDPLLDIVESGARYKTALDTSAAFADLPLRGVGRDRGGVPTDNLPSEWARDRMRPWGQAFADAPIFSRTGAQERVEGFKGSGPGALRTWLLGTLPAMPTTAIAKTYRDVLPAATQIRDAWARTHRAANDYYSTWGNQVQDWTNQLKYGRDVAKLMNDATLARAYVTDQPGLFAARNEHLNADEMVRANELRDQFMALTPEKQKLYNDVRNYYRQTHDETRRLEYEDVARRALPEASEEQIQKLGEQLRTKKGIEDVINNADHDAMSKLFSERWENSRATVREIAKFQNQGFVEGDYFPLRRYGNYVIRYGEPGTPSYGVEMFETSSEAKTRKAELDKQFAEEGQGVRVSDVLSKAAQPARREFVPESVFTDMQRAMARRGATEAQIEQVKDAYAYALLRRATHSEGAMSRARRNYVEGASTDAGKVLWNHFLSTGRRQGHLIHGAEEVEAFRRADQQLAAREQASGQPGTPEEIARSATQLEALRARPDATQADIAHAEQQHEWLQNPPTSSQTMQARTVLEELKARRAPIDGDTSDELMGRVAGRFTKASFIYHLARPAHLALQIADAHANAQSFLGARYGHGASAAALARAMRTVAPPAMGTGFRNMANAVRGEMQYNDWNMRDVMLNRLIALKPGDAAHAAAMRELDNTAHDYGLIDHSRLRELQRMSSPGAFDFGDPTGGKRGWTNVPSNMMNLFAAGEHAVDAMNRMAILKAGYDLAMRANKGDVTKPADVTRAVHDAIGFAEDAMPVYGAWNNPRIASPRGPIGPLMPAIMQYRLYGLHMYSVMGNLVRQAINRPEERAEALKALAGLVATHSLLAGASATMFGLPVVALLGAWDMVQGKEKPHNYETDFRQMVTEIGGETVGRFTSSGLLGLAGAAQQNTLKLSNMVNVPELRSFDKAGIGQWILQAMSGASGEVAGQLFQGMHHLTSGEWGKAAKELLPRVVGDPYKAYELATSGVIGARGRTVLPASQIGAGQIAAKAVGFNPIEPTLARERRHAEEELHGEVVYARQKAVDRYVASGGHDMSAVRAYMTNPDYRLLSPIKYDQLRNELKRERQRVTHPELYGMIPPKRLEQRYIKETRFQ